MPWVSPLGFVRIRYDSLGVARIPLRSVRVGCLGFRSCGLFGVPLLWTVWGFVRVGYLALRSCELFWVPFIVGSLGFMFWVPFVRAVLGSVLVGCSGFRSCGQCWVPFVWAVVGFPRMRCDSLGFASIR